MEIFALAQILAVEVPPLVSELAVVMMAAAAISYLCGRIGLVPIVGYLVAGSLVGPNAIGIVDDIELVEQMAEVGVIFLLFGIGLELSVDHLRRLGSLLLGGGGLQVALTIGLVAGACMAFGVDGKAAIYTGCLVSLSSTAIVLRLLSSRRETGSPVGEVAVAFLIFQDLAVVMMVLLVPMLGSDGGSIGEIVGALLKSALVIGFVVAASRRLIPRALDAVAERAPDEVFLLTVAAFALMVAYIASLLGLTDSLGAFIAGLVISSSRHRERALRYVMPFQMLFAAVFFASVGMLLDYNFLLERWDLVLVLAVGTVVIKSLASGVAARLFRRPLPVAVTSALLLAQLGEFAFVLEQSGRAVGLSPAGVGESGSQAFIATAVLLFVLTPLLDNGGRRLGEAVARRRPEAASPEVEAASPVVVVGGGEAVHVLLADALQRADVDHPVEVRGATGKDLALAGAELVVAIDLDPAGFDAVLEAAAAAPSPPRVLAWVTDGDLAARLDEDPSVAVIDAGGAADMTIARATLQAFDVVSEVRIDAITSAVEHLPPHLRRPLA